MKRFHRKSPPRLSRDAERAISLALSRIDAGSVLEERFWIKEMEQLVLKLVEAGNDSALDDALEQSFMRNPAAHDTLVDVVESISESFPVEADGKTWDALLIAIPLVVWSKYAIPSGKVDPQLMTPINAHLHAHILSAGARAVLNPFLYSVDQLPQSFSQTRKLAHKMALAAVGGTDLVLDYTKVGDSAELLADCRFLLATVAVPRGAPLFRWQETDARGVSLSRADCLAKWLDQNRDNLAKLVQGCAFDCALPEAFFDSCRTADRQVRPFTVRAATSFLETTLKAHRGQLRAVIAGVGESRIDEYRIAFTFGAQNDVVYGVVWPLYGIEDEDGEHGDQSPIKQIRDLLAEQKIGDVTLHPTRFAPEYCEECGAPFFADHDREMVHAELPEQADTGRAHFH